jgi:hypothetical protein
MLNGSGKLAFTLLFGWRFYRKALQIVFGLMNCTVLQCHGKGHVRGYYGFLAINNYFSLANYNNLLRCERCSFSTMDLDSDYYSSKCKDINGLWVFKRTVMTFVGGESDYWTIFYSKIKELFTVLGRRCSKVMASRRLYILAFTVLYHTRKLRLTVPPYLLIYINPQN